MYFFYYMTRRLILQVVPSDSMYEINGSVTYYIKKQETFIMRRNFFICGLTGWCLEILFTSIGNCSRHDLRLIGQTSIWMFPIYGMACIIKPLYRYFKKLPALFRGFIYSTGIFCFEYFPVKKTPSMSLGLQQCSHKHKWCHPS